jgi:VIT1/CCC1 family predicted Fe2+/Mn2+ transporter
MKAEETREVVAKVNRAMHEMGIPAQLRTTEPLVATKEKTKMKSKTILIPAMLIYLIGFLFGAMIPLLAG